ncbi:MAG: response regulator [Lachnospiraceae bacterium]|nr:response regulator [Lachnospiraceae bacterium]
MNRTAMIMASVESFIIKGIETKLKGIGVEYEFVRPNIREVKKRCDGFGLFIIYTDDNISEVADSLVYVRDHCLEENKRMIVIGTKTEIDSLNRFLSDYNVHRFFERPVDMEKLLDSVEKYMSSDPEYFARKSILIVDDDVSYMFMISDWLKGLYRVSMANSGMEAITWLAKNHADLILLDYEMPVVSGPQVLEMLRSSDDTSDIPVLFLTGKGDRESVKNVLSLKPEGYILKTVDKKGLKEDIAKVFAGKPLY